MSVKPIEDAPTSTSPSKAAEFLALHRQERPLLLANAWDPGSAKLLASLGFQALATTSSGYAATLARLDYGITREESLAHAAALVRATDVPVSADFENGFAEDIAALVAAVECPINVLARPGAPSVEELAALGVARISVGGAFAFVALGAAAGAARELLESGTYGFSELAGAGARAARAAFSGR
jgi:2-methylisocitrate lyase-like PEP mutase family enzyme